MFMGMNHSYLRGKMQVLSNLTVARKVVVLLVFIIALAAIVWIFSLRDDVREDMDPHLRQALEITDVSIWPGTVYVGDTANLVVEVENYGKKDAENAEIYVKVDKDDLGHISVRGYDDEEGKALRYVGDVLSGTTARHAFSVGAPSDCVGTFKLTCGVSYGYEVVAIGDIVVISKERFDELRRERKMRPTRHVTISGGGPVSVNVQTDKDKPIPIHFADEVGDGAGTHTEVQVHVTVHDHRSSSGTLRLTDMIVKLPKGFKIHEDANEEDTGKYCDLVEYPGRNDDDYEYYHVKAFAGDYCAGYIGELTNGESDVKENGDGKDYCNVLKGWRTFMCDMMYLPSEAVDLSSPRHLPFQVDVGYVYSSEKKVSFGVGTRSVDDDEKLKMCSNSILKA